jgi:hypothetical protein
LKTKLGAAKTKRHELHARFAQRAFFHIHDVLAINRMLI